MKTFTTEISLETICRFIKGKVTGSTKACYTNVAELREANAISICFYENEKYRDAFEHSKAGLILVPETIEFEPKEDQVFLKVEKPYIAFMTIVSYWLAIENQAAEKTISPQASIHPSAKIGAHAHIAPFVVIEENVTIGDDCYIGANTTIMKDTSIGNGCKIYPNVTIYPECRIGSKVIIHAGAVIGADGFGYVKMDKTQVKIPQVGDVVIEDDVEIGANTTIDRSTVGTTLIKKNTKIDNLVQIGHNCRVDEHSILCAQVGLAGNSHIGKSVYLAGQVGVAGHLKIDDDTLIGAQSGVATSLTTGTFIGTPTLPAYEGKKVYATMKDLPSVVRYVKRLMKGKE